MADGDVRVVHAFDLMAIADALGITKRGALKRADREGWPYETRVVSGGAKRFYSMATLPVDVQDALKRAAAVRAAVSVTSSFDYQSGVALGRRLNIAESVDAGSEKRHFEQGAAKAAALIGKSRARMDAKLELLQRLSTFAQVRGLGKCKAAEEFCAAYNSGELTVPVAVRQFTGADLHPATLRRWKRDLKKKGPAALAGSYGHRAGTGKLDTNPAVRDFVVGLLADKPHVSSKLVFAAMKARFAETDMELPELRTVQRWLKTFKETNAEAFLAHTNPDAWKNRYMAAFGSLTEGITRACQLWQLDSTPADLQLVDGRYSLVGVIDLAWRGFRLFVTKTSTADAVCQVMRRTVIEWGVPEAIKVDNGRDYASHRVASLLAGLHIEARFSAPFSPWEKGNIERAFRTFSHGLLELLPGYCGHNVAEAQEIRARDAFADRLFKKNAVVELKMTAAELQDFCDRWCRDYYAHEPHSGLSGDSPFQRFAQLRDTVRRIGDVRALDLLLGDGDMRTVTKKGLRFDGLTYVAPELASVIGQQVLVRQDDADIGRAVVYHGEQFLCIAECPEVTGVSLRDIAVAGKAQQTKRIQEAKAELRAAKRKAATRDIAMEVLDHKAAQNAALSALPAPNVIHLTPALEAASAAADALAQHGTDAAPTYDPNDPYYDVAALIQRERADDDAGKVRFARALKAIRSPGLDIEQQWLKGYRDCSEFRGYWLVFESFGAGTFGLDDEFNALLPADAPYHSQNTHGSF